MPINNLSQGPLDPAAADAILLKLQEVAAALAFFSKNLTKKERQDFGSINERNKLVVGKVNDYHIQQPVLQSPDVDWETFDESWFTRAKLAAIENMCASIIETSSDARILHDFDLYQMMRTDYDYTKYKAKSTGAPQGFTTKYEELKQFFSSGGGGDEDSEPEPEDGTEGGGS